MRQVHHNARSIARYLTAAAGGLLFPAAGVLCLAGLTMVCGLLPMGLTRLIAQLFWWAGAAWAGWYAGLHGRRHGAATGLVCGMLLSAAAAAGAQLLGDGITSRTAVRCAGMLVCGILGGILGVDTRIHRPPDQAHVLRRIGKRGGMRFAKRSGRRWSR